MKIIPFLFLSTLTTSCFSPPAAPGDSGQTAVKQDTVNFPLREAAIIHDDDMVDLQLPYTGVITTDSSIIYVVSATYKGAKIGFELQMPPNDKAVARLISLGQPSDNFLRVLRTAYQQDTGKTSHFADTVQVVCLSMGDYVDSLKKNGQGGYETMAMNKLFFAPDDSVWEAECYLNINPGEHCVEFKEKEPDYRQGIIHDLSKK
jgi:hypothetical protein